jgi:KDO2-lipid IV(A) lauroyltransferase
VKGRANLAEKVGQMRQEQDGDHRRWQLHSLNTGLIFGLTWWGVSHMPRWASSALGHTCTWLACHAMRKATAGMVENFRVVFPERSEKELHALALKTYRHYAKDTIETIRSLRMTPGELAIHVYDTAAFDRVREEGKGVLLLTGHIGNWELGGVLLRTVYDYPLAVVGLPETSDDVNQMRQSMRSSLGIESIEVRQAADTALRIRRLLAQNYVVAMLGDRPLGRDRVEVEFFGRPTPFLQAPALMGYLTGAPLVPSFIMRQPNGVYSAYATEPIRVSRLCSR